MARKPRNAGGQPPAIPFDDAVHRVTDLRKQRVASNSEPENLDLPVDDDIRITPGQSSHLLELIVDGVPVSHATVIDFEQQIGGLTVRMGGIAGVGTREDQRFKGYSRRVLENSLRFMRRSGCDTSMLFGISSFYPKYGFAPAFPTVHFTLAVRDAEMTQAAGFKEVEYSPQYLSHVLKMFNKENAGRTGPIRRDPKTWRPFRKGVNWQTKAHAVVLLDKRGHAAGYYVYDDTDRLVVLEVGYEKPAVFGDILAALAARAWSMRFESFTMILPPDHLFAEFCKTLGIVMTTHFRSDGEAMVRMINIPGSLQRLAPELGARMGGSGCVCIQTNLDSAQIEWSRERLTVSPESKPGKAVRMPQWALAQLLYGYNSARALAAAGYIRASAKDIDVLQRMFPTTQHFFHLVDAF